MRFRKIIAVIAAAALGVSLCGCTSPEKSESSGKLKVIATIFPAYDFARQVFGALEQHVFEEVRETGFARLFAVAAYVILDGHRHYRVGVIVVKNDLEAVREDVFLVIERYAVVVVFISATIHTQKGTCQQRKHQFVSHGSDLCLTSFGFTFKGTYKFSILWFRMKKKSEKPGRRPDFLFSSAAGFCIFASKERL